MTDKQKEAFKSVVSVIANMESNLKDYRTDKEQIKAQKVVNEIKRILKTVTRTTETLEDRIQRKLKEL